MSKITDDILKAVYNGDYFAPVNGWYVNQDGEIFSQNSMIAKFEMRELSEEYYEPYLLIAIEEYKSVPTWWKHKKELALSAMKYGIRVVFTNIVDPSGFGFKYIVDKAENEDYFAKELMKLARMSTYNEAGLLVTNEGQVYAAPSVYEQNAIETLAPFTMGLPCTYYQTHELSERELRVAVDGIMFSPMIKIRWAIPVKTVTFPSYVQLTNDIQTKVYPNIRYDRWINAKLIKASNGGKI